jgi:hypothetical protein
MTNINYLEVYQCPFLKTRFGDVGDGGYVVCLTDTVYDLYISGGIGNNIKFDNDFLKLYDIPAYGMDHTIKGIPQGQYASDKLNWVPKKIGKASDCQETNLKEYTDNHNDVFLKLDIEGGEYSLFESLDETHLNKISQIVMELHSVHVNNRFNLFEILNKTHTLFHAHANNYGAEFVSTSCGYKIPQTLELTFVRNTDVYKAFPNYKKELNTERYPSVHDYPNNKNKPEILLNYYPFLAT